MALRAWKGGGGGGGGGAASQARDTLVATVCDDMVTYFRSQFDAVMSNFIHQRVIREKKTTYNKHQNKKQSICKIIKRSLVCSLQNKL